MQYSDRTHDMFLTNANIDTNKTGTAVFFVFFLFALACKKGFQDISFIPEMTITATTTTKRPSSSGHP